MNLNDKMLAVIADVNSSVAEREELVATIATTLLTRKNLFILGDPGQAKSYAINAFRERITGTRQFERLLSKQTDEEQLFGRIDLSSLLPNSVSQSVLDSDATYQKLKSALQAQLSAGDAVGIQAATEGLEIYKKALSALHQNEPKVLTTGKIPEADICFLDEIFKCNDGVLNSLLTALNERKYTNEGRTYPIPVISFFAASNEIPNFNDPQEKILSALYDRLELKVVTENITEKRSRMAVLKNKQTGNFGTVIATITLDELVSMQTEVTQVLIPDAVNELADDILCELRKNGIVVSDRKYLGYYPIVQASAWLSGRTEVTATDLLSLKNYLWQKPSDRATVEAILNRMCINPLQDKVNDIRAAAKDVSDELNSAVSSGIDSKKAFRKFRNELVRVYGLFTELSAKAESDSERAMLDTLLSDLENDSRIAHDKHGYTYATLAELSELQ